MSNAAFAARELTLTFALAIVLAAGIGVLSVSAYVARVMWPPPPTEFYAVVMLSVPLLGVLLGALATRRAAPVSLHFNRVTGAIGDSLNAALWMSVPVLFGLGFIMLAVGYRGSSRAWPVLLGGGLAAVIGFVATIRVGTMIGYGVLEPLTSDRRKWPQRRRFNFLAQVLVGSGASFAFVAAVVAALRLLATTEAGAALGRLAEGLWVLLLPTAPGIAVAFASLDAAAFPEGARGETAKESRVRPVSARPFVAQAVTAAVLVLVLPATVAVRLWQTPVIVPVEAAVSGARGHIAAWLTSVPQAVDFEVHFPQDIVLEVPQQRAGRRGGEPDFMIRIYKWRPGAVFDNGRPDCRNRFAREQVAEEDDPPVFEGVLGWGCYSAEVETVSSEPLNPGRATQVAAVLDVLAARAKASDDIQEVIELVKKQDRPVVALALNDKQRTESALNASGIALAPQQSFVRIVKDLPDTVPVNLGGALCVAAWSSLEGPKRPKEAQPSFSIKTSDVATEAAEQQMMPLSGGAHLLEFQWPRGDERHSGPVALNVLTTDRAEKPASDTSKLPLLPSTSLRLANGGERLAGHLLLSRETTTLELVAETPFSLRVDVQMGEPTWCPDVPKPLALPVDMRPSPLVRLFEPQQKAPREQRADASYRNLPAGGYRIEVSETVIDDIHPTPVLELIATPSAPPAPPTRTNIRKPSTER